MYKVAKTISRIEKHLSIARKSLTPQADAQLRKAQKRLVHAIKCADQEEEAKAIEELCGILTESLVSKTS